HPDPLQPDARQAGIHRSAILADPDPWMIDVLGPPPLERDRQDRWARNVERIAAYRDIYQISDAADPLGPRPAEPTQRRAWDLARLGVDEHRRSLDLEVEGLHL
ncbi:MAG: hypothetical protein ACRDWW_09420, partial [Acidimicrobiales bacterium]